MNLRELVESSDRCIMHCVEGKWAFTLQEGARFTGPAGEDHPSPLTWYESIVEAAFHFFGRRPVLTEEERRWVGDRESDTVTMGTCWSAEWYPKLQARQWLRPVEDCTTHEYAKAE